MVLLSRTWVGAQTLKLPKLNGTFFAGARESFDESCRSGFAYSQLRLFEGIRVDS